MGIGEVVSGDNRVVFHLAQHDKNVLLIGLNHDFIDCLKTYD